MNLVILLESDFLGENRVEIKERRAKHIFEVHRAKIGDTLKVGLLNGLMGDGIVTAIEKAAIQLEITLNKPAPPPNDLILLLALPRPKMLKRIFQAITTFGVKQIYLMNSYRVEKSFWESPWLKSDAIQDQLILGLEQARDTVIPNVELRPRFKPFVEDEVPALAKNRACWLPHPGSLEGLPKQLTPPAMLAIGPEGGFIPYEVNLLQQQGFTPVHLGERILRVDTAVAACLSRLL